MKLSILILALAFAFSDNASAQISPSSCIAHDTLKAKYKYDADILALSRILKYNSHYKDSATIPSFWSDSIMNSLMAVYNCTLPVRDTIISPFVHVLIGGDYHSLTELKMTVDSSEQWVKDIVNGMRPNSSTTVEFLLTKYHFNNHVFVPRPGYGILYLISDSNYNHDAIGKEWIGINGVHSSSFTPQAVNSRIGDGSYISLDSLTDSFTILSYSLGWGDCPAGCTCRLIWRMKVYKPSCDVELLERIDYAGPACYLSISNTSQNNIFITPNPFDDYIKLPELCIGMKYSIYNISGVKLSSGEIGNNPTIYTTDLLSGLYILKLNSEAETRYFRMQKN